MYSINISISRVSIIRQLLILEGKKNQCAPWFKKTNQAFKKKYGFDIVGAPLLIKGGDMLWKLSVIQDRHSARLGGHRYERVDYLPIIRVGKFFSRLELKS